MMSDAVMTIVNNAEVAKKIREIHNKFYPNGKIAISASGHGIDTLFVTSLISNVWDNGIADNDVGLTRLIISVVPGKGIVLENEGSIKIVSTNPYFAMGSVKIKSNKATCKTIDDLYKKLEIYFTKKSQVVIDNWDNLYSIPPEECKPVLG